MWPLISVLEGALTEQEDDFLDSIHSRVVWGLGGGDKKAVMTNIEAVIKTKTAGSALTTINQILFIEFGQSAISERALYHFFSN